MIHLLHSGKFWLKLISTGLVIGLLTSVFSFIGLRYLFSPEHIHQFTQSIQQQTGRTIVFNEQEIDRSILPRPTLTLHQVHISHPHHTDAAIVIQEMKIGFDWENIFTAKTDIEKLVLKQADVALSQNSDGTWSLADLWHSQNQSARINRLIIEDSNVQLKSALGHYQVSKFRLNTQAKDADSRIFDIHGVLKNDAFPDFNWQGNGIARLSGQHWEIPAFHLSSEGRLKDEQVNITAVSSLSWLPKNNEFRVSDLSVQADSSYKNLHASIQSPLLIWKSNYLNIHDINSSFTAALDNDTQWNGSLTFDKANIHTTAATVDGFELKSTLKDKILETNFSASGPLFWQENGALLSNNLHIVTHQDSTNRTHAPRFSSVLEGYFTLNDWQHWQADVKGLFDKQPTALVVKYTQNNQQAAHLEAGIALQKLSLEPYWDAFQSESGFQYPALLTQAWMPEIEAQIEIGSITSPNLQIDKLSTLLSTNPEHILMSHMKAKLYGGQSEGGISLDNTSPLTYHIQQTAQNMQMRPLLQDLFGFHSIQGTGKTILDVTMQGHNLPTVLQTLNGSLNLEVKNGAWLGVDINNILQNSTSNSSITNDETLQTPFSSFKMHSEFKNGVAYHNDTNLYSKNLHITSHGATDWNQRKFAEELLISHATNQRAKPIPLKITGPIDNPSITIDFNRLTDGLKTSEEKQKALSDTLKEQWKWLNPNRK